MTGSAPETWERKIRPAFASSSTFDEPFLRQHAQKLWAPNGADKLAAGSLHIELISRVATQRLDYSQGVEESALHSIFELFAKTRSLCTANLGCTIFEIVSWHVLNSRVRPFTARWHLASQSGGLRALDASDEFRAELNDVQSALLDLDRMLQLIIGHEGYSQPPESNHLHAAIDNEMLASPRWRPMGFVEANELASREKEIVSARRQQHKIDPEQNWAAGISLSGGGIRSATFAIGVLAALARRNLLPQFDYISSVSGGGFAAGFLTQLLGGPDNDPRFGLEADKLPFLRNEGESLILRKVRHGASYLSGSFLERLGLATIQAHGIFINMLIVTLLVAVFAYIEFIIRSFASPNITNLFSFFLPVVAIIGILIIPLAHKTFYHENKPSILMSLFGVAFLLPLTVLVLHLFHVSIRYVIGISSLAAHDGLATSSAVILTWLTLAISGFVATGAMVSQFDKVRPTVLSFLSILFLLITESFFYNFFFDSHISIATAISVTAAVILLFLWRFLDINVASLHHYYRAKLCAAFLLKPSGDLADPMNLSSFDGRRALFPIINCALNVPSSKDPVMRGRLSDIFAITPVATGAGVLGYSSTRAWEQSNTNLDIGSTIALSGAAVSPQMGLRTKRYIGFWLAVLNLRLGIWLRRPGNTSTGPGVNYLIREMTATAAEHDAFLNISDGGHIENLGVYELLKRRCRFVVAIDGENDPTMTFHALTNLQRLAYIDFGITLDLNLDDLRLGEAGYSRSHFQLCRIFYPRSPHSTSQEIGYFLYLKLSLTGNEGEYLRRYKLDEPAFPHHSTADQFFSETQFEAYRSLGEHIGEKMFLPALIGSLNQASISLDEWFRRLGHSLLRPMPDKY